MRGRRLRTVQGVLVAVAAFASLRPIAALDAGVEFLFMPARAALELAAPAVLLPAEAAAPLASRQEEQRMHDELEARARRASRPQELRLPAGVRTVAAEVLSRPDGRLDELEVLLEDPRGVSRGAPVVWGDAFVGVVERLPSARAAGREAHLARVRLVTARDARVKARAVLDQGRAPRLVVGGIVERGASFALAVHSPEDAPLPEQPVVLAEDAGTELALANGWRLGRAVYGQDPLRDEPRLVGLEPEVDLEAGLARVLVLVRTTAPAEPLEAPAAGAWISCARGPLLEDRGRSAFPLRSGTRHGVRVGAAVADGLRFVGRVRRAGPLASVVERLEQPGATVHATALVEAGGLPVVLGRLSSLGVASDGRLRLRWSGDAAVVRGVVPVTLWTLAGEAGVPGGLLIGSCLLPVGPGPHTLLAERPSREAPPASLRVRVDGGGSQ